MPQRKILSILIAAVAAIHTASAQDWAQWRGPNRDGVVKDFVAPAKWPEKLKLIWKTEVGSGYSSPVVSKDRAWIHARKGQYFCLEAATGKVLWITEGREGANAAILNAKDALLILTSDANLIVAKKSAKGLEQVAKYSVADSATYAHPVAMGNRILVKDDASISLLAFE